MNQLIKCHSRSFDVSTATDTAGHGNCYGNAVTQGSPNNGAKLKGLEMPVQMAKQLVHQYEIKVEAIEASIHEMEKFYPKIKIIRPPPEPVEKGFNLFAEDALVRAA